MSPIIHRFDFKHSHSYTLQPASLRDRVMAQLLDGIFLGVLCALTFFLFSKGEVFSIWISPMIPEYLLEVKPGHVVGGWDYWWGGEYFSARLYPGKILHFGYPAPLLWGYYALYYTIFTAQTGQTPGKMLKKLVVMDASHQQPDLKKAFWRWLGYLISLIPLGWGFWRAAARQDRQTWHDSLCNTVVYSFEKR